MASATQGACLAADVGESPHVPRRVGHPHGSKAHNGTIISELSVDIWPTDMTTTMTTDEGQACIFVAVDHWTSECVGIHAVLNSLIPEIAVTISVACRR
jgi:hypothetical protein